MSLLSLLQCLSFCYQRLFIAWKEAEDITTLDEHELAVTIGPPV
jgi:hypothetical protein